MAESSGFFRSVGGDRKYTVDFLAKWVAGFLSSGVYKEDLAVSAGENMQVIIPSGQAWINGYYYRNDTDIALSIQNADGVLNRRDTVVLRWDVNERSITAQVLTGTPASEPSAPELVRGAEQYDLKLAEISIPAGTTSITQDLITDTRLDADACGIVHAVVDHIDTTTFYNQIQAELSKFKNDSEVDFMEWSEGQKQEFESWLDGIKDILDESTAGNLQSEIEEINTSKGAADGIATLDHNGNLAQMPTAEQVGAIPVLRKVNNHALTKDIMITKSDVGLSNVDNTADADKLVRYATTAGSAPANGGTASDTTSIYSALTLVDGGTTPPSTLSAGKLWSGY